MTASLRYVAASVSGRTTLTYIVDYSGFTPEQKANLHRRIRRVSFRMMRELRSVIQSINIDTTNEIVTVIMMPKPMRPAPSQEAVRQSLIKALR